MAPGFFRACGELRRDVEDIDVTGLRGWSDVDDDDEDVVLELELCETCELVSEEPSSAIARRPIRDVIASAENPTSASFTLRKKLHTLS